MLFIGRVVPCGVSQTVCQKPAGGGVPADSEASIGAVCRHQAKPNPATAAAPPTDTMSARRPGASNVEDDPGVVTGGTAGFFIGGDHATNPAEPQHPLGDYGRGGRVLGLRADHRSRTQVSARLRARPVQRSAPGY